MVDTRRMGASNTPYLGPTRTFWGVKPSVVAIGNVYTDSHTRTRRIAAPTAMGGSHGRGASRLVSAEPTRI